MSGISDDEDPVFMGSSDGVVQEDNGYSNKCLDYNEFSAAAINRELVNLENAAVNIENSNDVIIGPVTQFNVNGNVTIFQNKDGLPIGIADTEKPKLADSVKDGESWDEPLDLSKQIKNYKKRIFFLLVTSLTAAIPFMLLLHHKSEKHFIIANISTCGVALFSKQNWGGEFVPGEKVKDSKYYIVIKHTGGSFCTSVNQCQYLTKQLQAQTLSNNKTDIPFNFLIGGDGNIYEGRGFHYENDFRRNTYDIALFGNFYYDQFYDCMVNATKHVIKLGLEGGYINENYVILNHNQTEYVDSPGRNVYKEVITWDHYSGETCFETNRC